MTAREQMGAEIKRLRIARGLSVRELARRAGIAHSQVGRLELGTLNCTLETLAWVLTVVGAEFRVFATKPTAHRRKRSPHWTLPATP